MSDGANIRARRRPHEDARYIAADLPKSQFVDEYPARLQFDRSLPARQLVCRDAAHLLRRNRRWNLVDLSAHRRKACLDTLDGELRFACGAHSLSVAIVR